MTTGTKLRDYNVDDLSNSIVTTDGSIKVKGVEREHEKTIDELLQIEVEQGYSTLTDEEISRLIEWKTERAENERELELRKEALAESNKLAEEHNKEMLQQSKEFFEQIINVDLQFATCDGNEVN